MRRRLVGMLAAAVVTTLGVAAIPSSAGAVVIRIHPPGAPTPVVTTPLNTAIAVSWSAPASDGGSPVTGYIVKMTRKATCMSTGPMSCVAIGLKNGKTYNVTVRAVNAKGKGRSAIVKNIVPTTAQNCSYVGPYANLQGCSSVTLPLGDDLSNANLTGANLSGDSFYFDNLTDANLTNANLTNASLPNANLTGANLTGANLTGADLTQANLSGANLTGANLSGANLSAVTSGGITGTPSALPAGWSVVSGYLVGPGSNLIAANLVGANLSGADLLGAGLYYANLTNANLTNANLSNATLTGANLAGAQLAGADLNGITTGGMVGTPLSLPAGWTSTVGYLVGPGVQLIAVNLSGANLAGVDLTGASFYYVTLSGADLTGANFTGATISSVTWSNTTCPDGSNSDGNAGTCIGFGI